ncbi:DUF3027 domain-containing protein [Cellulomonas cellasea]|uniref:DUF3027 domain-containing protein n=1 Tax=Cellulomonas cellasea TaxID=43670 RepID=UPI0025A39CD6|nr:DUF3027 domain-containing protein [Cellulomonas cellasea]MDM8083409.1 DUF3027 domain-containing protein [Cellulomonas cellasea]
MATATKDAVLRSESTVELARAAAVELAEHPADVGEYLGAVVESERLVSHRFASAAKGYRGWAWTVTVARAPRARTATVCEAVLLPGDDAILAPEWVPWSERLRPGDIGPGDVLPFRADDPRLEPGWTPTGDPEVDEVAIDELALARARVLSPQGLDEVAERWYRGSQGPTAAGAVTAAAACVTCAFLIPLQGSLGRLFGVCANEWSPDDGRVVSLDHGCGAHSETDVEPHPSDWPAPDPSIDEMEVEVVRMDADTPDATASASADAAASDADAGPAEVPTAAVVVPEIVSDVPAADEVADTLSPDR